MSIALAHPRLPIFGFETEATRAECRPDLAMTAPTDAPGSDAELLRRIAQGDRAAFAHFYDRFSRPLYATALRIVQDAAEAQDVVHDAFVTAWDKADTFDAQRGSAFSWIVTLVRNRALDRVRSRRRRAELLANAPVSDLGYDAGASEPGADDQAILGEERRAVRGALASLNPDQKRAVELAFFSGLTQEQIAQSLNEPLGTVKARIRRGLLKLNELLAPHR